MAGRRRPVLLGAIATLSFLGILIACAVISAGTGESVDPTDPNHTVVNLRNDESTPVYGQRWACQFGDSCSYASAAIGLNGYLAPGEVAKLGINGVRYRFTDPSGAIFGCLSAQFYPNVEPPETVSISQLPACPT